MIQAIFLTCLLTGIACLIGAISVARQNWRRDIEAYSRKTNAFKVLSKPQQYAVQSAVALIKTLALMGYIFVGLAIICLGYQFMIDFAGP